MKKIGLIIILLSILVILPAENLEESLQKLSETAAKSYVEPLVSAFGTNLNTGWFRRTPIAKKKGLDFEFSVSGSFSMFPSDKTEFSTSTNFTFSKAEAEQITEYMVGTDEELIRQYIIDQLTSSEWLVSITGATIIGSAEDSIKIVFPAGQEIQYIDETGTEQTYTMEDDQVVNLGVGGLLSSYQVLPMVAPQIGIGTLYGTKLVLRFLPTSSVKSELGSFKYFGWGIQHNPAIWLKRKLPLDISFGAHFQTLKIGSIVKTQASSYSVQISKTYGWRFLNTYPYLGYMIEKSKMDFKYDFLVEDDNGNETTLPIDFSMEGENKSRVFLGFALRIGIFDVNFDLNFGKYTAVNLASGIGVEF